LFTPEVQLATDPDSSATACSAAISRSSIAERHKRSRLIAHDTWDRVVERLGPMVMSQNAALPTPPTAHAHRGRVVLPVAAPA